MGILQTVHRRHVRFNPADASHRAAYFVLRTSGKQDEDLRFVLEEGFSSVLTMMQTKIADYFSRPVLASDKTTLMMDRTRKQI